MAVVSPLGNVGGNRLVRYDKCAACLCHLTHLAVEVFDGTRSVLTHHQSADTVVGGVASAVIILHVSTLIAFLFVTMFIGHNSVDIYIDL